MSQDLATEVVSEPVAAPASPPLRPRPRVSAAFIVFLLVQAGAFVFYLGLARRMWFYRDDWEYLAGRGVNIDDLLRQHGGHITALHIVVYRAMYAVFGLRSYIPYQVLSIGVHLTVAFVLRFIMRRAGVSPWLATAAASLFVLFGAGGQDILWGFQIAFTAALLLGLFQMLLANHDGPVGPRDWFAMLVGIAALLFSGVGVAMLGVVGLATLIRRGWRAAAVQVVVPAVLFAAWYFRYDDTSSTRVQHISQLTSWVRSSTAGVFDALGQVPFVGWVLAVVLVVGFALAWRDGALEERRVTLAMPTAMLVGAFAFVCVTGFNRATLGVRFATSSRYLHITAALLLPAIAVACQAIIRRRREFLPAAIVLFVIGMPSNLGHTTESFLPSRYYSTYEQMARSLPRMELAHRVPRGLRPELVNAPWMTVGWLIDSARSGRLPSPSRPSTPLELLTNRMRLSLEQLDEGTGVRCQPVQAPVVRHFEDGQSVVVRGALQIQYVDPVTGAYSMPVSYGTSFLAGGGDHTLRAVGGPVTVRIASGKPAGLLCEPGAASGTS